ncbi:MAG: hypothetical protein ABL879_05005 [Devosia sp.]
MAKAEPVPLQENLIRAYKVVLQGVLDQRPSGTRQRLADALGKHRSFVTQMTSSTYPTPIPQRHLAAIFSVCHFTPEERESFLAAYRRAHRGRLELADVAPRTRHVSLTVPDLGDEATNTAFDHALGEFVARMAGLMKRPGGDK